MAKRKSESAKQLPMSELRAEKVVAVDDVGYFLSLSLENIRCFGPKQTLDLSDGHGKPARWTVILGINGTGKTTILQSLVGFERLAESNPIRPRPRFLLDRNWRYWETCQRAEGCVAKLTVTLAASPEPASVPSRIEEYQFAMSRETLAFEQFKGTEKNVAPWCCGYGAGRRVGTTSLSESTRDDRTATLFSDKAGLRNPEEWLLRLDYAASKPSEIQADQGRRLSQAKDLLLKILPDIEDIRLTTPSDFEPSPQVEFKTPYGWVPLRQLGYGYQTLITWVTDLANRMVERYPDSRDPLAEPAVVLVDEIDLHLHPQWQRKLMTFLTERFPKTQFIVTAHSPLVAQAAADANLAVLRRDGDHVIIDNDVDNIRGWRIDQILTSDLFGLESARPPQIEKLLAERKELLTKPKQSEADRRRLKLLEAEIGDLPTGETAHEVRELQEIRKSIDVLTKARRLKK